MNRRNLTVLIVSTILSCGISSFIINPKNVEAKETKTVADQSNYDLATNSKEKANEAKIESKEENGAKLEFKQGSGNSKIETPNKIENDDIVKNLNNELNFAKSKIIDKINNLRYIKSTKKEEFVRRVNIATSKQSINEIFEEARDLNLSYKTQVKYQIKYVDDSTGKELYSTITKIDFANEIVTETARSFDGYQLVSPETYTTILNKGNNEPIVFHYISNELVNVRSKAIDKINNLKYIENSKKDEYVNRVKNATSKQSINDIFEEARELNLSYKTQVKYQIKYVDDSTGKEIYSTITKIDFADEVVTETAMDFKKYRLVSPKTQTITLNKDKNEPIVFHYKLYDDYISLDDFVKEKVDYTTPLNYENTNFTGKRQELMDYIIKNIYKSTFVINFTASKEDKESVYRDLFNKSTKASSVRFARNWETEEKATDVKDVFNYTLRPSYLAVKSKLAATEEKIDEFVNKNLKTDMPDVKKVQMIHDYIITIAKPAPGTWMTKNGNNVHETPALFLDGVRVCEAYSMAFNRIAERAGLESRMVVGIFRPFFNNDKARKNYQEQIQKIINEPIFDRKINHAWNQVKVDGKWYNVDVYHDDYYVETSNNNRYGAINFLKSDKHFRDSDRIWNPKYTDAANEDYKLNNYTFISEFSK